jgi:Spy/CpxP family protein refolding chaperone
MKSTWMKPIGAAVLAAGMTFAYAETPAQPQPHAAQRQGMAQRHFDRMAAYLNLTDAQKTQAQAVLKEAHESARQFAPQLKQDRQALREAVKAGNTDQIASIASDQGKLMGQMLAIRTQAFAKIYQTLTPEQKAKADTMEQHFRGAMQRRAHNRRQG